MCKKGVAPLVESSRVQLEPWGGYTVVQERICFCSRESEPPTKRRSWGLLDPLEPGGHPMPGTISKLVETWQSLTL